jgi:hypothetical protein
MAGLEGRPVFFLPAVLLAVIAGVVSAGRGAGSPSKPVAAMAVVSGLWLASNVTRMDAYAWPTGLEDYYTGTGFCGDLVCFGQIGVTMPFMVSVAYALGALLRLGHDRACG